MNTAAQFKPAAETLGPLTLKHRVDGPWLAVRAATPAEAASIVLVGDERCPDIWRRIDADQPVLTGDIRDGHLTPLRDFGVACTLYPHSRVLSVYRVTLSRARRFGHPAGGIVCWEGERVQRLKFPRTIVEQLKAAVKDCNTLGRVPS